MTKGMGRCGAEIVLPPFLFHRPRPAGFNNASTMLQQNNYTRRWSVGPIAKAIIISDKSNGSYLQMEESTLSLAASDSLLLTNAVVSFLLLLAACFSDF